MLIYNGVFVFYFCFSSFFCCFWAYCRALIASFNFFLLFLDLLSRPYCFFLLLNLITSFYCRAATNWVHKYKWKLRSVPLKISAYFFLLQSILLTSQLIYDIIKWGLFFFKKKFFVAHSFTSSICLTKLCQDGYSS